MTEYEFESAIQDLNLSKKTIEITYSVLVLNEKQSIVAQKYKLTRSAICQKVNHVLNNYKKTNIPKDYVEVTAYLTKFQSYTVKTWHRQNLKELKLGSKKP